MTGASHKLFPDKLLVALGGNAIHPEGIKGTGQEQFEFAQQASEALLPLLQNIPELVLTHGNGPGVGKVLMRQAIASKRVASMPLDICVANSQGGISYVIMQALQNTLKRAHIDRVVSSIICEVEVDHNDPAFLNPEKPLGYFFTESEAKDLAEEFNWFMKEDANRGWRMVVASPRPQKILDSEVISYLSQRGVVVITGGGGGIPVISDSEGHITGVEAVVDKDLTSVLLAQELGIEHIMILTSVHHVATNFGTDSQHDLTSVSLGDLKQYLVDGHFSAGSMAPKIEAVINFLENGGKRAIIAHLEDAYKALCGTGGTQIIL
ncbi:MAG: carbamate kinase [Desulfofustis sp.]|nr:carbamate kinase [Desulfofustis sp.]